MKRLDNWNKRPVTASKADEVKPRRPVLPGKHPHRYGHFHPESPSGISTTSRDARMRRIVKQPAGVKGVGCSEEGRERAGRWQRRSTTLVFADRNRTSRVRRKLPQTKDADREPHRVRED